MSEGDIPALSEDVAITISRRANYLLLAQQCDELASVSTSKTSSWRISQMADQWRSRADAEPRDANELH